MVAEAEVAIQEATLDHSGPVGHPRITWAPETAAVEDLLSMVCLVIVALPHKVARTTAAQNHANSHQTAVTEASSLGIGWIMVDHVIGESLAVGVEGVTVESSAVAEEDGTAESLAVAAVEDSVIGESSEVAVVDVTVTSALGGAEVSVVVEETSAVGVEARDDQTTIRATCRPPHLLHREYLNQKS